MHVCMLETCLALPLGTEILRWRRLLQSVLQTCKLARVLKSKSLELDLHRDSHKILVILIYASYYRNTCRIRFNIEKEPLIQLIDRRLSHPFFFFPPITSSPPRPLRQNTLVPSPLLLPRDLPALIRRLR
ncbi:hypothetical protein PUN28_018488 [Cardiocondyla obscurior]|uniref:Uncharacterized protein n=1 Tax=Cardiocondyla obscurior TaxID=286306 RepID=A0AAW2EI75_9HYME